MVVSFSLYRKVNEARVRKCYLKIAGKNAQEVCQISNKILVGNMVMESKLPCWSP